MSVWDRMCEAAVGQCLFPWTNYLANNRGIKSTFRNLRRSQWASADELHAMQLARLARVLQYAYRWVPFYTRRFREIGLEPGDVQSIEDLAGIPPLTREEVIAQGHDLVDLRLQESVRRAERSGRPIGKPLPMARFRRHQLIRNTSTGSTGAPTVFFEDGRTSALCWAQEWRVKDWYNLQPCVREARMKRVSSEFLPDSLALQIRRQVWRQLVLPGMNLSDDDYVLCQQKLETFRPKVLWGITTALAGLTDYYRRNGGAQNWRPELVITWASPLYDHEDRLFREVFDCHVTNIYGTREVGHVAARCPAGSMHVHQEDYVVENTQPGAHENNANQAVGQLLVTTLFDNPMPFIRYQVGDLGRIASDRCDCGRALPVLRDILGRTGDVFFTSEGRMIAPNFWCRVFMDGLAADTVDRFQIIYRDRRRIDLRVVKKSNYTPATEQEIRRMLASDFSVDTAFDFQYVPEIHPQPSGKHQMVINNISKPNGQSAE